MDPDAWNEHVKSLLKDDGIDLKVICTETPQTNHLSEPPGPADNYEIQSMEDLGYVNNLVAELKEQQVKEKERGANFRGRGGSRGHSSGGRPDQSHSRGHGRGRGTGRGRGRGGYEQSSTRTVLVDPKVANTSDSDSSLERNYNHNAPIDHVKWSSKNRVVLMQAEPVEADANAEYPSGSKSTKQKNPKKPKSKGGPNSWREGDRGLASVDYLKSEINQVSKPEDNWRNKKFFNDSAKSSQSGRKANRNTSDPSQYEISKQQPNTRKDKPFSSRVFTNAKFQSNGGSSGQVSQKRDVPVQMNASRKEPLNDAGAYSKRSHHVISSQSFNLQSHGLQSPNLPLNPFEVKSHKVQPQDVQSPSTKTRDTQSPKKQAYGVQSPTRQSNDVDCPKIQSPQSNHGKEKVRRKTREERIKLRQRSREEPVPPTCQLMTFGNYVSGIRKLKPPQDEKLDEVEATSPKSDILFNFSDSDDSDPNNSDTMDDVQKRFESSLLSDSMFNQSLQIDSDSDSADTKNSNPNKFSYNLCANFKTS